MGHVRWWLVAALLTLPELAGAAPRATQPLGWRPSEAWGHHPLVAQARQGTGLDAELRQRLLGDELPAERAVAVLDAMSEQALTRHAVERHLIVGIAGRLAIGPSGATHPDTLVVADLEARHALLLGWLRLRLGAGHPEALNRRADRLADAGAVQLLEQARAQAPSWQIAHLALAVARWDASDDPKCANILEILAAAHEPKANPVLLASAEQAAALALRREAVLRPRCGAKALQAYDRPIQLAAAEAEVGYRPGIRPPPPEPAPAAGLPASATSPTGATQEPFVLLAPVFRGWLSDPLVRAVVLRTPLDPAALAHSMANDPSGDAAIAALNASLHGGRLALGDHAEVVWSAILMARGQPDADPAAQDRVTVGQLTATQAVVLGYARATAGRLHGAQGVQQPARHAPADALFDRARGELAAAALLAPIFALAVPIDQVRRQDPCAASVRAEALRFVAQKSALPDAAKSAIILALRSVEANCPTPTDK